MPCPVGNNCFVLCTARGQEKLLSVELKGLLTPAVGQPFQQNCLEERFTWKRQPNWTTKPAGVDDG